MLRFINGFEVDAAGNSRGIQLSDAQVAVRLAQERNGDIAAISASAAEAKLNAAFAKGEAYDEADFAAFADGRGLSVGERLKIKLTVGRTGQTIQQVMHDLHIG